MLAEISLPNAVTKNQLLERTTVPYARLARLYDMLLGDYFLLQLRHTFEQLTQRNVSRIVRQRER